MSILFVIHADAENAANTEGFPLKTIVSDFFVATMRTCRCQKWTTRIRWLVSGVTEFLWRCVRVCVSMCVCVCVWCMCVCDVRIWPETHEIGTVQHFRLFGLQKCCTVPIFCLQVPIKCCTVPKKPKKTNLSSTEPPVVPKRLVF